MSTGGPWAAGLFCAGGCAVFVSAFHGPERVLPGQILRELIENDRVVGGVDLRSTERAVAFYGEFVNGEVLGRHGTYVNPDKPADNNGNPLFTSGSSFNFGYTKISGSYPSANPGTRTVAAGDSLQSMAESLYGDATLWYLIADANGLASDRDLRVGQTLTVPNRVTGASNNSNTFKPYNPGEVVGNTTPNLPAPPPSSGGGCGGLGMLIMVVVAVVATIYTAGAASAYFAGTAQVGFGATMAAGATALTGGAGLSLGASIGLGAMAGAAGSIASQVAGNALGIQDGFSWKGVAMGALGGAISAGTTSVLGQASSVPHAMMNAAAPMIGGIS